MTNPNVQVTEQFTITSSFNDDVYAPKIISLSSFDSPEISIVTIKSCDTFDVELSAYNAFLEATYEISLICASYIKEASEIRFYLSWSPSVKNDKCSSQTDSLYSYECAIKNEFKQNKKETYLSMYLQGITPQKLISLSSLVLNGKMGSYKLVAEVSYKGFTYLRATSNEFFIKENSAEQIKNADIQFKHYPINRNYDSIYTVKVPSPHRSATNMIITLPDEVRAAEDSQITCYALNQTFRESYINLLR